MSTHRRPSRTEWLIEGECGVIAHVDRQHYPQVNDPMPSHVCYRAASNVQCAIRAVTGPVGKGSSHA